MYHVMKTRFRCPQCNHMGDFNAYDVISVAEQPELKAKVLNGSIFEYTCKDCGCVTEVMYPILYHDRVHSLMIHLNDTYEIDHTFDENETGTLICRSVYDPDSFKEKILIFEHELDDRIIEIMKKYRVEKILTRNPNLKIEAMYYAPDETGDHFAVICEDEVLTTKFDHELYQNIATYVLPRLSDEALRSTTINSYWAMEALKEIL